jgi:hypothetical protein
MWMLSAHFGTDDGTAVAFSVRAGRARQAVLGATDRVGDEPRLLVDFNRGQPLLSVRGEPVGDRTGNTVHLWGREYRIRRQRWRVKQRFEVTSDDRTVPRLRERSAPNSTVRTFATHSAPGLDPVVTLALIILEARPDRMGILNEVIQH